MVVRAGPGAEWLPPPWCVGREWGVWPGSLHTASLSPASPQDRTGHSRARGPATSSHPGPPGRVSFNSHCDVKKRPYDVPGGCHGNSVMSQRSGSPRGGQNGTAGPNFPAEPPASSGEPRFSFRRPGRRTPILQGLTMATGPAVPRCPPAPAAAPLPPGPAILWCPRDPPRPRSCGTRRPPCVPHTSPGPLPPRRAALPPCATGAAPRGSRGVLEPRWRRRRR